MKEMETFNGGINAEGNNVYYEDKELNIICQGCYQKPYGICYYKDGNRHREDGPAIIRNKEGEPIDEDWFMLGVYHRLDGPAVIYDDVKEWWLDGLLVYASNDNNIHKYNNLSESFKKSIIKYKLSK
jgi:hypothetical protein